MAEFSDEEVMAIIENAPIQFGLRQQGHIDTIEDMLLEGKSWKDIGEAIGWCHETAKNHYQQYFRKDRERQRIQTERLCRERAEKSFADHVITERLNVTTPDDHRQPHQWRSWRCQKPGSWIYGFDITAIPGTLIVSGDIGELMVQRCPNMVAWARGSVHSTDYFAEKVPRNIIVEQFSYEVFREWCLEWLIDDDVPDDDKEMIVEVYERCEESFGDQLMSELYDVWHCCDPPNWNDWDSTFLWCREAVRWFVNNYETEESQ